MTNEERQFYIDYKETFGSERGKRVLANLDKEGMYKKGDLFNPSSARITDFNLGANCLVRMIHDNIDKNLDEVKQEQAIHETVI